MRSAVWWFAASFPRRRNTASRLPAALRKSKLCSAGARLAASALFLLLAQTTLAQVHDNFADGDFTSQPMWIGDAAAWTVAPFGDDAALNTNGSAVSDTIYLATASQAAYGKWSFTFSFSEVNLSNYNGVRVFLMADTSNLEGIVNGYFVQFGTNNTDEIRLYRQDGRSSERLELGRGSHPALLKTTSTLNIEAARSHNDEWTLTVAGDTILSALDGKYRSSAYFGVWVKHTRSTARAYFFDDIDVEALPDDSDFTPPALVRATPTDSIHLTVAFDEPAMGCRADLYTISPGIGKPADVLDCLPDVANASFTLALPSPLLRGASYNLTATGVRDVHGNVLTEGSAAFFFGEVDAPKPRDLVINEINYAPSSDELEFVEVYNRSTRTLDLREVCLSDARRQAAFCVSDDLLLNPSEHLVFARNEQALTHAFPAIRAVSAGAWPVLNNTGDAVYLSLHTTTLDSVVYSGNWGKDGLSLERKDPSGPSNYRGNWGASISPLTATPGTQNSLFAPDTQAPILHFAEETISGHIAVFLNEPLDPSSILETSFLADDQQAIRVFAISDTSYGVEFRAGRIPDLMTVRNVKDEAGNTITPASMPVAHLMRTGQVVINEIMYDPLMSQTNASTPQTEFIELVNTSEHAVSLRGAMFFSADSVSEGSGMMSLTKAPVMLGPHEFAIVVSLPDGAPSQDMRSLLSLAFPASAPTLQRAVLLPVQWITPRGLNNNGETLRLLRRDSLEIDLVSYQPSWHSQTVAQFTSTRGISLERIDPLSSSDEASNWGSSVSPDGGTPGRENTLTSKHDTESVSRGIEIEPATFSPDGDGMDDVAVIRFALERPVNVVRVRIFDATGRLIRALAEAHLTGSEGSLTWNGEDNNGSVARAGIYVVLLEAVRSDTGRVEVHKEPVVLARVLQ